MMLPSCFLTHACTSCGVQSCILFLRAVPWHGSLGTSPARKAVSGQGFQNTFAVAHEICLWALAPHASYVSQKVIMLHQSTSQGRSQLGPRSSEPAKEKTAGLCTSGELLLVAGRPVSPAYSVIAATMSLR